jgi:hypothetical protein
LAAAPIGAQSLPFRAGGSVSTAIVNFATLLGTAGHEHIIVAATATIGVFGIRLRQLIGYDRLRSQPA